MGWAKYDEDNRNYIEERWASMNYSTTVFNYTSGYTSKRASSRYASGAANSYVSASAAQRTPCRANGWIRYNY